MSEYGLKQEVIHPIHGKGKIIAIEPGILTIRFDNDKELPIRITLKYNTLKIIKDF